MPGSDVDLRGNILSLIDQNLVGRSIILAHKEAPDELKKEMIGLFVNKGFLSIHIGDRKGKTVYSSFINQIAIDHFFRTCRPFKGNVRDIPPEFIIGRTHMGTPIILRLNEKFMDPVLWYDEAIRHSFLILFFCICSI
jgi:hypothetical protein